MTHLVTRPATLRTLVVTAILSLATAGAASAQSRDDLKVNIYPVFAWIPTGIDIDVEVPPFDGGAGGSAEIVESRFDGAFLGGFSVAKGLWRVDVDGMWAAVGGDRQERPELTVDADVIYFHATGGIRIGGDFYAIGGVRRLALKYDIKFADQPNFERKPGVTDPVVGLGYHKYGRTFEAHATFEGGGFGVGTDVELAGGARIDWKPIPHFGLTAGYSFLYFKVEDEVANRTLRVEQTLHGPIVGIGFYF